MNFKLTEEQKLTIARYLIAFCIALCAFGLWWVLNHPPTAEIPPEMLPLVQNVTINESVRMWTYAPGN